MREERLVNYILSFSYTEEKYIREKIYEQKLGKFFIFTWLFSVLSIICRDLRCYLLNHKFEDLGGDGYTELVCKRCGYSKGRYYHV